jgi:polyisoprenoid-binding protein YceI
MISKSPLGAALVLALAIAGPALAQRTTDAAQVPGGVYQVEPNHTRVLFAVSHFGFTTWYGDFTHASGSLTLDPKTASASKVEVSVPTASVSTTNAKLDGELKDPDWFDAAKYPTISFVSRQVTVTGPGRADVAGDLTLHGVTKPVTLHAKFNAGGMNPMNKAYTVGFEVSGKIKRSDFGVSKYVPLVGDEVDLIISAAFEHKAP